MLKSGLSPRWHRVNQWTVIAPIFNKQDPVCARPWTIPLRKGVFPFSPAAIETQENAHLPQPNHRGWSRALQTPLYWEDSSSDSKQCGLVLWLDGIWFFAPRLSAVWHCSTFTVGDSYRVAYAGLTSWGFRRSDQKIKSLSKMGSIFATTVRLSGKIWRSPPWTCKGIQKLFSKIIRLKQEGGA